MDHRFDPAKRCPFHSDFDLPNFENKNEAYISAGNKLFHLSDHQGTFSIHLNRAPDLRCILFLYHCTNALEMGPEGVEKIKNSFLSMFLQPNECDYLGVECMGEMGKWPWTWVKGEELLKDPLDEVAKRVLADPLFATYRCNIDDAEKKIRDGLIRGLFNHYYRSDMWKNQEALDIKWEIANLPGEAPRVKLPTQIIKNKGTMLVPASFQCGVWFDIVHDKFWVVVKDDFQWPHNPASDVPELWLTHKLRGLD